MDAGDAGTEMADLLPSNLLKFAFNAVPFEMAYERAPWQPPVEATDRRRPVGGEAPIQKTPTRAAAATPAAAATADGKEDEECGAGVGW